MATSKTYKILELVRKIEEEYGSMCNVPDSDPTYKELRGVVDRLPVSKGKLDYIKHLLSYGFSVSEISSKAAVSQQLVWSICDNYGLEPKRSFHYILCSPNNKVIYVESLLPFVRKFFDAGTFSATSQAGNFLRSRGWDVLNRKTRWSKLPTNVYYHVSYLDKVARKKGRKSYIYQNEERED